MPARTKARSATLAAIFAVALLLPATPAHAKTCGSGKSTVGPVSARACLYSLPQPDGWQTEWTLKNNADGLRTVTIWWRYAVSDRNEKTGRPIGNWSWPHGSGWKKKKTYAANPGTSGGQLGSGALSAECLRVEIHIDHAGRSGNTVSAYSCDTWP